LILHKKKARVAIKSPSSSKHITPKPTQPEDYKGILFPFGILLTNIMKLHSNQENKPASRVMEFSGWGVWRTGRNVGGREGGKREGVMYREGLSILSLPRYKERESQSFLKQNFFLPTGVRKTLFSVNLGRENRRKGEKNRMRFGRGDHDEMRGYMMYTTYGFEEADIILFCDYVYYTE
jgi:hypothetical protein